MVIPGIATTGTEREPRCVKHEGLSLRGQEDVKNGETAARYEGMKCF